jgi:DNA-binding SARP family transcriptional activator
VTVLAGPGATIDTAMILRGYLPMRPNRPRAISVRMIDGLSISVDGTPVDLRSVKPRALLAALALAEDGALSRSRCAALLWPNTSPERARLSLRGALKSLNDALADCGFQGFDSARDQLRLDPATRELDLETVLLTAEQGVAHPVLLAGSDPFERLCAGEPVGEDMRDWVNRRAAILKAQLARTLERALEAAWEPTARRDLSTALLALDPRSEAATLRLIEAHEALGEPQRALDAFDALWRALDERGAGEPRAALRAAIERIMDQSAAAASEASPPSGRPDIAPRLRVVFQSLHPAQEGAAGLAEAARIALAAAAARFSDWRIAVEPDPEATHVVRGVVSSEGGGAKLVVTLEMAETGALVAAATAGINAEAGLVAASAQLVAALRRDLDAQVAAETADVLLAAQARPMRARALTETLRPEAMTRAAALGVGSGRVGEGAARLRARAIALGAAMRGAAPDWERLAAAEDYAEKAVDADPLSAENRAALGWCLLFRRRFDAAVEEFLLGAHLNPADAALHREAALAIALAGDPATARSLAAAADRLDGGRGDPAAGAPAAMLAFALGEAPHDVRAEADLPPTAIAWRAAALAEAGETSAAVTALRTLPRLDDAYLDAIASALPFRDPNRAQALRATLDGLRQRALRR